MSGLIIHCTVALLNCSIGKLKRQKIFKSCNDFCCRWYDSEFLHYLSLKKFYFISFQFLAANEKVLKFCFIFIILAQCYLISIMGKDLKTMVVNKNHHKPTNFMIPASFPHLSQIRTDRVLVPLHFRRRTTGFR